MKSKKVLSLFFLAFFVIGSLACSRIESPTDEILLHPHEAEEPLTHTVSFYIPKWIQEALWEDEEQLIQDLLNLETTDREEVDGIIEAIRMRREQSENYAVFVDVDGMALIGTRGMSTRIQEMANIMLTMTQKRPEIRKELHYDTGFYFVIYYPVLFTTDQLPEWREAKKAYGNSIYFVTPGYCHFRQVNTGDKTVYTFAMCVAPSKVFDYAVNKSWLFHNSWEVGIHEFAHAMDYAIRKIDLSFQRKITKAYENAKEKGLWTYHLTAAPDSFRDNPKEYWAEGVEAWFVGKNETRIGRLNGEKSPPLNKATLPELDPLLYELLNEWLPYVDIEP